MKLVVVGLGYVGLPLAVEASRAGLEVLGLDISTEVVSKLSSGRSHIEDISDADVAEALKSGFIPTIDPNVIGEADAVVITVPTPLTDHLPDLSAVEAAGVTIGEHLRAGQLVVLESTSYPGTTEEVLRPILEEQSGLIAGRDFHLAFSPERIDPGNPTFGLRNTPKVVGGIDTASTEAAAALYGQICETVVPVSGTREAEMAKLLENTYRHINIALVNEMAIFSREMGIDLWEAIRAAATKPFGFEAFYPGPGVGGHCIPIDRATSRCESETLGIPSVSSSLRRKSTIACPPMWSAGQRSCSTHSASPSTDRGYCCSASPTSPTSPTRGRRRREASLTDSWNSALRSPMRTRTWIRSSSTVES